MCLVKLCAVNLKLSRVGLATVGMDFTCKCCLPGLSGALRKCLPQVYPKFVPNFNPRPTPESRNSLD